MVDDADNECECVDRVPGYVSAVVEAGSRLALLGGGVVRCGAVLVRVAAPMLLDTVLPMAH